MSTVNNYANPANVTASMAPPDPKLKVSVTLPVTLPKNNMGLDVKDWILAKGLTNIANGVGNVATLAIGALSLLYGAVKGPIGLSLGLIPGFNMINLGSGLLGKGFKGLFGSKKYDFHANQRAIEQLGGDWMGIANKLQKADGNGYKKNKWNNLNILNLRLTNLADDSEEAQQTATNSHGFLSVAQLQEDDGLDMLFMHSSKNGGKLERVKRGEWKQRTKNNAFKNGGTIEWKPTYYEEEWKPTYYEVESFKEGGKTELSKEKPEESNLKSIIPEGALHAHKHHMEDDENITKKGIPVVDMDGQLQAEIEKDEWILNLHLTNLLEELYKEFYAEGTTLKRKDELAIEAGKLITCDIMTNLDDRTGLVDKCLKGGKLDVA